MMISKTTLLAAAAASVLGLGAAAANADPPHGAGAHIEASEAETKAFMELAMRLAHGAELAEIRPAMHALAVEHAAGSGAPLEAILEHVDQVAFAIVAAREEGPEALHELMMHMFGELLHH